MSLDVRRLNPDTLPAASGYSQVVTWQGGRQVLISGQVAVDAEGAIVGRNDLEAQVVKSFENVAAALKSAGAEFADVVKLVTYVVDLDAAKAAVVRQARARYLVEGRYPASTMVGISSLVSPDLLIEIEATALIPQTAPRSTHAL